MTYLTMKQSNMKLKLATYKLIIHLLKIHKSHLSIMHVNLGDKLVRTAKPHKILSGRNGRLIAVKLNIISRKTLGGIQTNLDGQALNPSMQPIQGLYALRSIWFWWWRCSWISCIRRYFPRWLYL